MRLTERQQWIIKTKTTEIFSPNAQVLLFGARVNDNEKGGDIDLLIELDSPVAEQLQINLMLNAALQIALRLQKIDIITHIPPPRQHLFILLHITQAFPYDRSPSQD